MAVAPASARARARVDDVLLYIPGGRAGRLNRTIDLARRIADGELGHRSTPRAATSSAICRARSVTYELERVTQDNATAAEELASTATELSSQAQHLQVAISFFDLEAPSPARYLGASRASLELAGPEDIRGCRAHQRVAAATTDCGYHCAP